MAICTGCCAGIIGSAALAGSDQSHQQAQQGGTQAPMHSVVHEQHQVLEAVKGAWLSQHASGFALHRQGMAWQYSEAGPGRAGCHGCQQCTVAVQSMFQLSA